MNFETFCSAPWFELRIDWDGQYRPCCGIREQKSTFTGQKKYYLHNTTVEEWMSSEYSQYIRQNLTKGIKLPECSDCWEKEQHGLYSLRQFSNDNVTNNQGNNLDNTWVKLFVKKHPKAFDYKIVSADVKLSNVCNFSCAMCNPHDSSKIYDRWRQELDNKFVKKQIDNNVNYFDIIKENYQTQRGYQHLIDLLDRPLIHLKLLGGEPLLDKTLFQILVDQPIDKKNKIHLHFVTNGSLSLVNAVKQLQGYKSVSFSVSLEGIGDIQDYVRFGSNWSIIEKNILEAKQQNIELTINHTLQAMSVLKLSELLNWCNKNFIKISLIILNNPEYLSISVLPKHIRQQVIDNLNSLSNISLMSADKNSNNRLSVNNIKSIIDSQPDNSNLYSEFLEYISWYERNLPTKLGDICPELSH